MDDYEILCAADELQKQILSSSPDQITIRDMTTLCRICRHRGEDEDMLAHLIPALNHVIRILDTVQVYSSDIFASML